MAQFTFILQMKVLRLTKEFRNSAWISTNSSSLEKNHLRAYALMNVSQRQYIFKIMNQDDHWH